MNVGHNIQVEAGHYFRPRYLSKERWVNYWHQIYAIVHTDAKTILEIGPGAGIVSDTLRKLGYNVDTMDIDPQLKPTFIGSVLNIPRGEKSYDLVLCAEVLEHLPFEETQQAMREIRRVTRKYAVITLPHVGKTFAVLWKVPLVKWKNWIVKIPHFWQTHVFNGQHYWEVGKKGYSKTFIARAIKEAGFHILSKKIYADDPAHIHFLAKKIT